MKRLFLLICFIFAAFALNASPCLAKAKTQRQTEDKPEFLRSIETITKGRTLEAPETNAVHVTIAPLKLIFTISF